MKLLSEKEAAYVLNCSPYTLQKNRRTGAGIPFVRIGRSIRYREEDIENYIQNNKYVSTAQY
jgi:excisionase family DNA binding protein